jgi:hypothetical protein
MKFTRASRKKNEGITVNTSQLEDFPIFPLHVGKKLRFITNDDIEFFGTVSRNCKTVYVPLRCVPRGIKSLPAVGRPVSIRVENVVSERY